MLSLPPSVRVFVCNAPTDMRKSFDGLCALVETVVKQDPFLCGGPRYVAGHHGVRVCPENPS